MARRRSSGKGAGKASLSKKTLNIVSNLQGQGVSTDWLGGWWSALRPCLACWIRDRSSYCAFADSCFMASDTDADAALRPHRRVRTRRRRRRSGGWRWRRSGGRAWGRGSTAARTPTAITSSGYFYSETRVGTVPRSRQSLLPDHPCAPREEHLYWATKAGNAAVSVS
jgi:hypothetical protein